MVGCKVDAIFGHDDISVSYVAAEHVYEFSFSYCQKAYNNRKRTSGYEKK